MDSLGIRMSMLALIICDSNSSFFILAYWDLGCTTRGEHHVMVSPSGTFWNMFSFTACSSHSLRGFCRWYGIGCGFWATGMASGSISSLTSISLPVLVWNSLLTTISDWKVSNVSLLGSSSLISFGLCFRALNWYSFVTFTFAPLSGLL